MLVTLIPMFDENMVVSAYSIFSQKTNLLLNPILLGSAQYDGGARVIGLEVIQNMGIETLSKDKEVFVPITNISVFADIESQCEAPHERIVLLIDNTFPPVEMYVQRLQELKNKGYKIAMRKLSVQQFEEYRPILKMVDYMLLNNKKIAIDKAKIYFGKLYPDMKLCAGNIDTMENFEKLKAQGGYQLYEGGFYRVPITKGQTEVAPLKVNYIKLLNMVNDENFDLTAVADIVGRDTALTISLLKMVNRIAINSEITSIRHAAAMLGQKELRKWINTAVVNVLYADKPNEITRVSLLRAKFAENLAKTFEIALKKDELFMMGLFSVLDVILEKPMEQALAMVGVSKDVSDALVFHKGKLALVLDFMMEYEMANWQEVSRQMILLNIKMDAVEEAYLNSLRWYREMMRAGEGGN